MLGTRLGVARPVGGGVRDEGLHRAGVAEVGDVGTLGSLREEPRAELALRKRSRKANEVSLLLL